MSFCLFKLHFTAAVHFGSGEDALGLYSSEEAFRADTLFSALCHTAISLGGEAEMKKLVAFTKAGSLLFSDAMPYQGDTLYLPKPCANGESNAELSPEKRKAVKKLRWIPVKDIPAFSLSLKGGKPYEPDDTPKFGVHQERTATRITEGKDTLPYQMGSFRFLPDCGLWFLCACPEEYTSRLTQLVEALGFSGIGGKTGSGFGSYELYEDVIDLDYPFDEQTEWLHKAVCSSDGSFLLLSTALPKDEEMDTALDGAAFQMVRRGGFVRSENFSERPLKKTTQYLIASGAVFTHRFSGDVYDVSAGGTHPVYRYAKPLFLGVDL